MISHCLLDLREAFELPDDVDELTDLSFVRPMSAQPTQPAHEDEHFPLDTFTSTTTRDMSGTIENGSVDTSHTCELPL